MGGVLECLDGVWGTGYDVLKVEVLRIYKRMLRGHVNARFENIGEDAERVFKIRLEGVRKHASPIVAVPNKILSVVIYIIAVNPTLKIAFCPKFKNDKEVWVWMDAC